MKQVLNVLLTHQRSNAVAAMVEWWAQCVPRESIVIAYGGSQGDFDTLTSAPKLFIADARLTAAGDLFPKRKELRVNRMAEVMRAIRLINPAEMIAQDIGSLRFHPADLPFI